VVGGVESGLENNLTSNARCFGKERKENRDTDVRTVRRRSENARRVKCMENVRKAGDMAERTERRRVRRYRL